MPCCPATHSATYDDTDLFTLRSNHSPRIMSQLMLVRSARRPSTETQKKAVEVVQTVLAEAMKPYS